MKLLLDAPEHLWGLIERKKYFPAAWLFLLARVVHRALVRDDEQDEATWRAQDVDISVREPVKLYCPLLNLSKGGISTCPAAMGCGFAVPSADYTQGHLVIERI